MLAIYKRELRAYFHTVIGFLFIAANIFLMGLYFVVYNMYYDYPYFQYAVQSCGVLMIISVPILTMRMLAEERKNKTDQLILTAPVSVFKIVLAKYLSALTIFAIPCLVSCLFPVVMSRFGEISWGEGYLALFGYFLFGAASIAIGMFISSLFENQIIAAVVSFVALFLGYMMQSVCTIISTSGNIVTKVLGFYDLTKRFEAFMDGTLEASPVIYFVSLAALFVFLTVRSIQKRRYSVSKKQLKLSSVSLGSVVIAIAAFALINIGGEKFADKYLTADLTTNKMYSLTEDTKKYLAELDENIDIYVLSAENGYDESVAKTLSIYDGLSDKITVTYIDPSVNPRFYAGYTDTAPSSGSLIVSGSKRSKVIDYNDLYEQSYSMDYSTYSYNSDVVGYDAEGQITGAIDYCLSEDMPVIYVLEGHGETPLDEAYENALNKANIEYETLNLMSVSEIAENAACLYIGGPTGDLSDDDLEKIKGYLDKGGKVILALTLTGEEQENLSELMEYMNLSLIPGIVLEEDSAHFYGSKMYEIPDILPSDQTAEVYGAGYNLFVPYNVGVKVLDEESEEVITDIFLASTDSAFLREDYTGMTTEEREDGDIAGPFVLGVSASRTLTTGVETTGEDTEDDGNEKTAEMVVFSSVTMFTDAADSMVSNANRKVFISTVGKYSDKENAISIPSKSFDLGYLSTTMLDILVSALVTLLVLPVGLIVTGIVIWARRRKM